MKAAEEAAAKAAEEAAAAKMAEEEAAAKAAEEAAAAKAAEEAAAAKAAEEAAAAKAAEEAAAAKAAEEAAAAKAAEEAARVAAIAAENARRDQAASAIQCRARMQPSRALYDLSRELIATLEAEERTVLAEQRQRHEAAKRVQADQRCRVERARYQAQQAAAVRVQAAARRMQRRVLYSWLRGVYPRVEALFAEEEVRRAAAASRIESQRLAVLAKREREEAVKAARRLQGRQHVKINMAKLRRSREGALCLQCNWRGVIARRKATHAKALLRMATRCQALWQGYRTRSVYGALNSIIISLEIIAGEQNARVNAAISMQRAFHAKRARKAALARKKQINAFATVRAVRCVQRAFRSMPERMVRQTTRLLVMSVVLLSVNGSAETNAVRRIQMHVRLRAQRKREQRAAERRAKAEERMHLQMSVNLGRKDVSRTVPWSTYARKAAHHSVADDGGLSLYGGPPRRPKAGRKPGGLTSVVTQPRAGEYGSQHPVYGGGGEATAHDQSTESLTGLLPGHTDLLPTYVVNAPPQPPQRMMPPAPPLPPPVLPPSAQVSFLEKHFEPMPPEETSATWPQPPGGEKPPAYDYGRRLRFADPDVISSLYRSDGDGRGSHFGFCEDALLPMHELGAGPLAKLPSKRDKVGTLAAHETAMANDAAHLPRLVAPKQPARETQLLTMYGLSPRNRLTPGYATSAYESHRAHGYAQTGGPRLTGRAGGGAQEPPSGQRQVPPAPRRAWVVADGGSSGGTGGSGAGGIGASTASGGGDAPARRMPPPASMGGAEQQQQSWAERWAAAMNPTPDRLGHGDFRHYRKAYELRAQRARDQQEAAIASTRLPPIAGAAADARAYSHTRTRSPKGPPKARTTAGAAAAGATELQSTF